MPDGLLDGLPVLDLTDRRGEVAAYLLGRLGADVIRVEPAGTGAGPKTGDDLDHDLAYNAGKRRVTLDPDSDPDRRRLQAMAEAASVIFESGPAGLLDRFGLDRQTLAAGNPNVVIVSVTPFGLDGPRALDPASELTIAALGGPIRIQGAADRAPLGFSVPQVWRHAGAEAAVAALVARARQQKVGGPQLVDVSAQSVMTWTMLNAMEAHEVQGADFERTGAELRLAMTVPLLHRCRDGHVVLVPRATVAAQLVGWMVDDGVVDRSWLDERWTDWDRRIIDGEPTLVTHAELCDAVDRLCLRYRKAELLERGLEVGATIAPVNDLADLLAFEHLGTRRFWETVEAPGHRSDAGGAVGRAGDVRPGAFVTVDGHRPGPGPDHPSRSDEPAADRIEFIRPAVAPATKRATRPADYEVGGVSASSDGDHRVDAALPFAGLRVADFSWIGVGPISAKCLADHGATVVRIESGNRVDGLRHQPPFAGAEPGLDRSNFFGTFNTSKRSLALDLKTDGGLRVARRLVGWADVVIDSFTPGAMARLGLGPDDIRAENPSAITVTTSLLGCGGHHSKMAGYGYHAAAIAGFFALVGWPDRAPDGPWLAYTDTIGPRFIIPSILAALERRARTGRGCHIEAAQLEIGLQLLGPELIGHQRQGRAIGPRGNRHADLVQGVYRCRGEDDWVAVTVQDDEAWWALRRLLGAPSWADAIETPAERLAAHDRIDEAIEGWTSVRPEPEAERLLREAGIAAGRVQRSRDLLADPQYEHRGFYRRLDHEVAGTMPYAGHQYRIDGYDHGPRAAAPALGQHTFEVLTDLLGFDADEIAEIAATGALE